MNVAIFGGTFDPVHRGHLHVARAAQQAYNLGRIYFVPADIQPLKQRRPVTPYQHRYAMLTLATRDEKTFLPSLMEAPGEDARRTPSFTIHTVRRFRASLPKSDRLFFLLGIDSFLTIANWRQPEALLREVEFIVASRPGFSLADVSRALPRSLRPKDAVQPFRHPPATGDLVLGRVTLHLLADVEEKVSATQIRSSLATGRGVSRFLDDAVAAYIAKMHLYKTSPPRARRTAPARRKAVSVRDRK